MGFRPSGWCIFVSPRWNSLVGAQFFRGGQRRFFPSFIQIKILENAGRALNTTNIFPSIFIYEKTTLVIHRITRSRRRFTSRRAIQPWLWNSAATASGDGHAARAGICSTSGSNMRHATGIRYPTRRRRSAGARFRVRRPRPGPFLRTVSARLPRLATLSPVREQFEYINYSFTTAAKCCLSCIAVKEQNGNRSFDRLPCLSGGTAPGWWWSIDLKSFENIQLPLIILTISEASPVLGYFPMGTNPVYAAEPFWLRHEFGFITK